MPMIVGVLVLTSCAGITHTSHRSSGPGEAPTEPASWRSDPTFDYPGREISYEDLLLQETRRYQTRRITFPSIGDNGQKGNLVTIDYHKSSRPGKHPVVIVFPIWGRHLYPSNAMTRTLRKRSNGAIHVLNVLGPDFLIDWPKLGVVTDETEFIETWTEGAEREITTVIDTRRLIDWAASRPEIDATRIGLIGFSHGAMLAPALAAQEPRITASVFVMGGAHPNQVIARCEGARTEGPQLHAQKTFGWSRDELESRLDPIYGPVDAANYPNRVDPSTVLIFEAGRDECVPESSRNALWEAMGRPERYVVDSVHRKAFYTMTPLRLNWMRKTIWSFFESHLLTSASE
jgi:dienelactone hydrolase